MMQKIIDTLLIIALLSTLSLLQGCSTVHYVNKPYLPTIPSYFMQPCEDLPTLKNGSQREVVRVLLADGAVYKDCANRYKGLQDVLIKFKQNMEGKE